jgi:hypothetical protein
MDSPGSDGLRQEHVLSQFDTPNESIVFKWAFPNYDSDPTAPPSPSRTEPGGKQRMYGDLSIGDVRRENRRFSWSDPRSAVDS